MSQFFFFFFFFFNQTVNNKSFDFAPRNGVILVETVIRRWTGLREHVTSHVHVTRSRFHLLILWETLINIMIWIS